MEKSKEDLNKVKKTEKTMLMFGRVEGKKLFLNINELAQRFKRSKDATLTIVSKLIARDLATVLRDNSGELVYLCRVPSIFQYTSWELIQNLSDRYFNLIGQFLQEKISSKKVIFELDELEKFEDELELPKQFIYYFINCFIHCGLIKVSETNILSFASKNVELTASQLKNIALSKRMIYLANQEDFTVDNEKDLFTILKNLHQKHDQETSIKNILIEVNNSFKIAHICEIGFGHQDTDYEELERTLVYLESASREHRPDIIVIGGGIQGSFQHVEKKRRNTLVKGLNSDGQQLVILEKFMKRVSNIGIKVIFNLSDDDKIWAENTAVFMMNGIEKNNPTDSSKKSVHFMEIDKMKGTKIWDFIYDFVWRIALEYQIRIGRRFYSADEVEKKTGGFRMEESSMLLSAYNMLINGESLPSDYSLILNVEKIPLPGKTFNDFTVVDDCKFEVLIKDIDGRERKLSILEKHYFRLTANSMIGDPTSTIRSITAQYNSMNAINKPNVVFIEHEQQPFVFSTDGILIASLPGMHKPNIERRSQNSNIQSDPSHRILTTRKEIFGSGTMPITFFSDGSFEVELNNNYYMEKASISSERIAIVNMVDWQTGSVTATSDLQAIFLDYCFHEILPNYPTYIKFLGDIIQGFNYGHHPIENTRMGLIAADAQKEFIRVLIGSALTQVPKKHLNNNLMGVDIIPGNHEWNSGSKWPGVIHCEMIASAFREAEIAAGSFVPIFNAHDENPKVRILDSAYESNGNHYKVWAGHEEIGGYGYRSQHLIVDRGAKGVGGPPVYALKSQLIGNSESMKGVDILFTGHWHSPQLLKIGNTTGIVSGSLAGTSGYEYARALHATIGCSIVYVGGGLPPTVRFLNAESLIRYKTKGFYSEKNLAEHGFVNDLGFNRLENGFAKFEGQPQSAVQKFLWSIVDGINWDKGSLFGKKS